MIYKKKKIKYININFFVLSLFLISMLIATLHNLNIA